jgi:hypothetical protein
MIDGKGRLRGCILIFHARTIGVLKWGLTGAAPACAEQGYLLMVGLVGFCSDGVVREVPPKVLGRRRPGDSRFPLRPSPRLCTSLRERRAWGSHGGTKTRRGIWALGGWNVWNRSRMIWQWPTRTGPQNGGSRGLRKTVD